MLNILNQLAGMQLITLLAVPVLVFISHGSVPASAPNFTIRPQRCADDIHFFFNDRGGKNIGPADFDSIVVSGLIQTKPRVLEKNKMKGFILPTGCGVFLMRVEITYRSRKMELIIKRIPGDEGDIFLYSIPFAKGTYTFDFEFDLDKNCEEGVKGWHSECKISPDRIKKVTPDSSKRVG